MFGIEIKVLMVILCIFRNKNFYKVVVSLFRLVYHLITMLTFVNGKLSGCGCLVPDFFQSLLMERLWWVCCDGKKYGGGFYKSA